MKIYFLTAIFLFVLTALGLVNRVHGQTHIIDSLQKRINNSKGVQQCSNMLALSNHLLEESTQDSSCIYWANKAEKEGTVLNNAYIIAKAAEVKGRYYFNSSAWDKSIQAFEASLSAAQKITIPIQKNEMNFKGLMGLGEVYNYKGDYVSALDYRLKGLKLIDSIPTNVNQRVMAYLSIANDFRHLDQRTKAIEYLRQIEAEVPQAKGNHQLDYYYEYYQNLFLNDQIEQSKQILQRFDSGVAHFTLSTTQQLEFAGIAQKLHGQFELYHTKNYKAAVAFFKKYLHYSVLTNNQTHIAIAYNKMGIASDSLKDYTEAIKAYKQSYEICMREQVIDYGYKSALGLASLYEKTGDYKNAYRFSSTAYTLKEKLDAETKLQELNMLEVKYQTSKKEKQITELKLANAQQALIQTQQKQSLTNTRFLIVLLTLIGMIILFALYRYYHKKQLKETAIRTKISRDLHDDIGATLSSINLYGELAHSIAEHKPADSKEMIHKMTDQAKELLSRMSDVIWSMKSVDKEKNSFSKRLINYSSQLLTPKHIRWNMDIDENMCRKISSPVVRNNLLLIAKEALNNIAKYSEAKNVRVVFKKAHDNIILVIQDDGIGFQKQGLPSGNGLDNMKARCEQLKGVFSMASEPGKGVTINCTFPLAIFSYSG